MLPGGVTIIAEGTTNSAEGTTNSAEGTTNSAEGTTNCADEGGYKLCRRKPIPPPVSDWWKDWLETWGREQYHKAVPLL